jgi:preprotein translocase subunit SecA
MAHDQKQAAYAADITYGTNNEFGFDYLRDNMVYSPRAGAARLNFAIVDEVDSILIDEARTPLIISGQAEDHTDLYVRMNQVAPLLTRGEGGKDKGDRATTGSTRRRTGAADRSGPRARRGDPRPHGPAAEGAASTSRPTSCWCTTSTPPARPQPVLPRPAVCGAERRSRHRRRIHRPPDAGPALVRRPAPGGRGQGGVSIQAENQTLASITFQNYFRMYGKLAGMTGTADTEAYEFHQIYGLETVVIPTNRPMIRKDMNDQVYRTAPEKYAAVIADIRDCHERGQPVLVGTTSIESSELLSGMLRRRRCRTRC